MENMDKGLTAPKWVLIVWPKIPQMPKNLSAQFVCPSPKILDFNEKSLNWASVVRVCKCCMYAHVWPYIQHVLNLHLGSNSQS